MRKTVNAITWVLTLTLLAAGALALTGCDDVPEASDAEDARESNDGITTPAESAEEDTDEPETTTADEPSAETASDGDAAINEVCTRCHSRIRIDGANKTAEEWDSTIERMIGYGADPTDAQKAAIREFLAVD